MQRILPSFFAASLLVAAQQDQTREIWDNGFREQRPHAGTSTGPSGRKGIAYRPLTTPPDLKTAVPVIGVTIWQLRRANAQETSTNTPRLLIPESPGGPAQAFVPERIRLNDPLKIGDRVRLAIESPREGFLYVIDREQYRDGSHGAPYLLFPLESLNRGDNRVSAGRLVEIPGQRDAALRVDQRDARQSGEELLVIFSPDQLPEIVPETADRRLPEELVTRFEREFNPAAVRLELVGPGGAWTNAEKAAGTAANQQQRHLTPEDPMPQTIFVTTGKGGGRGRPLIVHIPLEVRR